jgi:hypothetical protein
VAERRVVDIADGATFALIPPCVDPRFDHNKIVSKVVIGILNGG